MLDIKNLIWVLVLTLATSNLSSAQFVKVRRNDTQLFNETASKSGATFNYGQDVVRGVNLGGWLVLEPWITPSLFQNVNNSVQYWDEWTLCETLGKPKAQKVLSEHWDKFITKKDFRQIKAAGLNHVRIPIGFWAFDVANDEPYVSGQFKYLQRAVMWAKQYDINVMVDLHGVPGSQNGYDNSGHRGQVDWAHAAENVQRSQRVVTLMTEEFSRPIYADTVKTIEVINEPAAYDPNSAISVSDNNGVLRQYYKETYNIVAEIRKKKAQQMPGSHYALTIHDGFSLDAWGDFMQTPNYQDVILDHHYYTVFDESTIDLCLEDRIKTVCDSRNGLQSANSTLWTVVGEWSPAITDCAGGYTNVSGGSQYAGTQPWSTKKRDCTGKTGPLDKLSDESKNEFKTMFDVQRYVFETSSSGWIMWTWKTEEVADWSYSAGIEGGWIPQNLDTAPIVQYCS